MATIQGMPAAGPFEDEPTKPDHRLPLRAMSPALRESTFGHFSFKPRPRPGDPEAIIVDPDWVSAHIVGVRVPQLAKFNAGRPAIAFVNVKVQRQFLGFWHDVEAGGLLDDVRSWNGSWVQRYKRLRAGGPLPNSLSSHCWGTAFDINYMWNKLGQPPAALGQAGSVLRLVEIAQARGYAWGGYFGSPYQDGNHFEVAVVQP